MQPIQEQKSPSFWAVLFVLFLITSIVIVAVIYLSKKEVFAKKEEVIVENITYYRMELQSNAAEKVNYTLKGVNTTISGVLNPIVKEMYSAAEFNRSYLLEARGQDYYYGSQECLVMGDMVCRVELKRIGNYSIGMENSVLKIIQLEEGVLQQPLICIAWRFDVYIVKLIGLEKTITPERLKSRTDVCYGIGGDLGESREYGIDITRINPKITNITFYLIDKDADKDGLQTYEMGQDAVNDIIYEVVV